MGVVAALRSRRDRMVESVHMGMFRYLIRSSRFSGLLYQAARKRTDKSMDPEEQLKTYGQVYQVVSWVYAALFQIVSHGSGLRWYLYRPIDGDDRNRKEVSDHPLLPLFKDPNPEQSFQDLVEETLGHAELQGSMYWAKEKEQSVVVNRLWGLRPDRVRPIPDPETKISGYIYSVEYGKEVTYERDEIVHFKYWNPMSDYFGQGSLTALKFALVRFLRMAEWNAKYFDMGSAPGGVLEFLEDPGQEPEEIRQKWEDQHAGAERRHRLGIVVRGKYQPTERSPKDADWIEGSKQTREEILSAFGVPPSLVGLLEYANYANMDQQTEIFWEGMKPRLRKICQAVRRDLLRPYDPELRLGYDLSDVKALQDDENEKVKRAVERISHGLASPNEIRSEEGKEPYEGGDEYFMPMALLPIGSSAGEWWNRPTPEEQKEIEKVKSKEAKKLIDPAELLVRAPTVRLEIDPTKFLPPIDPHAKGLAGDLLSYQLEAAQFGLDTIKILGFPPPPGFSVATDPAIVDAIAEFGLNRSEWVVESDFKEPIRKALEAGIEAHENVTQIGTRVRDAIADFKKSRYWSDRIARTEIGQSSSYGRFQGILVSDALATKMWLSARDKNTRKNHLLEDSDSHKDPVQKDKPFRIMSGMAPGWTGKAHEDIQCRCDLLPGPPKDKKSAGWCNHLMQSRVSWDRALSRMSPRYVRVIHKHLDRYTAEVLKRLRGEG